MFARNPMAAWTVGRAAVMGAAADSAKDRNATGQPAAGAARSSVDQIYDFDVIAQVADVLSPGG